MRIRYFLLSLFLLLSYHHSLSMEKDSNVVITESRELHEFIWKGAKNEVQVKQTITNAYYCNHFATILPVLEAYHDQMSIDDIALLVDNKRINNIKPQYSYFDTDGTFFSDQRICFFNLPLQAKGSSATVSFKKTIFDPRYFCRILFPEQYAVMHKEVKVKVPRWMKVELKEMNFDGFQITRTASYDKGDDADIFTYTIKNLAAISSEANCPGTSYTQPHILVLTKEANHHNNRKVYISTVADQYAWYRQLIESVGSNESVIKAKAIQLTIGKTNDLDKIKAIFYWVQNNIRYVAFENGIAGFRPDKADEVLRKNYGDCKGVANLTKELLHSLGFDARLCWIGTNDIAYDYSTPSIAVDNHMICAINWKGKMYFLDATETYLAFDEYAERIQGRQCLVEDGNNYILTSVPASTYQQNLDEEKRTVSIQDKDFKGTVLHQWSGEKKESILTQLNSITKNTSEELFIKYLSNKNLDYIITDFKTSDITSFDQHFSASYLLHYKNAVSSFGKEYYFTLDFARELNQSIIDPSKRIFDYWFPSKTYISRQTELIIPQGYRLKSLPSGLEIKNDNYEFIISYTPLADKIVYKKTLIIKDIRIRKNMFEQWNRDIEKLTASYNEQIVLTAN